MSCSWHQGTEGPSRLEVKANFWYDQLLALRDAGVDAIQPGIESLNDDVLLLMRKGCTALQEPSPAPVGRRALSGLDGVEPANSLYRGEPPEAYARMAELDPARRPPHAANVL